MTRTETRNDKETFVLSELSENDFYNIESILRTKNEVSVRVTPSDHNNKLLGSSQRFIEAVKVSRASRNLDDPTQGTLILRKRKNGSFIVELLFTDGHHRAGLNVLEGRNFTAKIDKTWDQTRDQVNPNDSETILGFNCIIQQLRRFRNNV